MTADQWLSLMGTHYVPEPNSGCWLWIRSGTGHNDNYGKIRIKGRELKAHRVSYELLRGPIPPGLTLDHLCRTTRCVNPDHLEIVTLRENILRGSSQSAVNFRKTACKHGHQFTPENTYLRRDGKRDCRTCLANTRKRWELRQRSARELREASGDE